MPIMLRNLYTIIMKRHTCVLTQIEIGTITPRSCQTSLIKLDGPVPCEDPTPTCEDEARRAQAKGSSLACFSARSLFEILEHDVLQDIVDLAQAGKSSPTEPGDEADRSGRLA